MNKLIVKFTGCDQLYMRIAIMDRELFINIFFIIKIIAKNSYQFLPTMETKRDRNLMDSKGGSKRETSRSF